MKVYNTLSRTKEEFVPQGDEVTMYVCGINPYSDAHIGHAMSYIFFDVVRRYLQSRGHRVRHVQNITDIEDNIIATANRLGISVPELTQEFTKRYDEDMEALNVLRADEYPRAMGEIEKIIEVTRGLIDKGFAYAAGGSVYFRVRKVPDYGKLSHRTLEAMEPSEGATGSEEKEDTMDFALWKAAKPDEPSWDSPWGRGRPGWHIECSAMSLKYLGETIDIHGGGQDLIFPHHENEIAQSESFTGKKPFVRYWLHNGMVQLREEKMSKSLGNLITIREALGKYSADAIRIFVLSSHYRSPLTYSEEALEAAERGADRLRQAANPGKPSLKGEVEELLSAKDYYERFERAMDDDLNTPQAIAVLFDLASIINRAANLDYLDRVDQYRTTFRDIAGVLGLKLEATDVISGQVDLEEIGSEDIAATRGEKLELLLSTIENTVEGPDPDIDAIKGQVNLALGVRDSLRKERQYQRADEIRNRLTVLGFTVEDTPQGTEWKRKR